MLSFEFVALTPCSCLEDTKRTTLVRQGVTPIKNAGHAELARNGLRYRTNACTASRMARPTNEPMTFGAVQDLSVCGTVRP